MHTGNVRFTRSRPITQPYSLDAIVKSALGCVAKEFGGATELKHGCGALYLTAGNFVELPKNNALISSFFKSGAGSPPRPPAASQTVAVSVEGAATARLQERQVPARRRLGKGGQGRVGAATGITRLWERLATGSGRCSPVADTARGDEATSMPPIQGHPPQGQGGRAGSGSMAVTESAAAARGVGDLLLLQSQCQSQQGACECDTREHPVTRARASAGDEASPQPLGRQVAGGRCPERVAAASAHGIDEHVLAQLPANLREEIKIQMRLGSLSQSSQARHCPPPRARGAPAGDGGIKRFFGRQLDADATGGAEGVGAPRAGGAGRADGVRTSGAKRSKIGGP